LGIRVRLESLTYGPQFSFSAGANNRNEQQWSIEDEGAPSRRPCSHLYLVMP
jgi:hypothetical protein